MRLKKIGQSARIFTVMFPLTAYIEAALEMARYDKLEDGSFAGEIPKLKGVIAFSKTLRECERELRSTLEDWILVGLRLGLELPVICTGPRLSPDRTACTQDAEVFRAAPTMRRIFRTAAVRLLW